MTAAIRNLSERQKRIQGLLASRGRLSIAQLTGWMKVAAMTIRRDLTALERAGLLTRTHGGCVLQSPFVAELSFFDKQLRRQAQKTAIARTAVLQLKCNETIYLDTGTTALQVARALPPHLSLRVFTNNLRVAMELFGRTGVEVIVYGGALAKRNPDLKDEIALGQMQQYRLDTAIVGGDALDAVSGEFYSADIGTAALSRAAQRQAERVILVLDSSKIGRRGLAVAGRLGPEVTLITDSQIKGRDRAALLRTNSRLLVSTAECDDAK